MTALAPNTPKLCWLCPAALAKPLLLPLCGWDMGLLHLGALPRLCAFLLMPKFTESAVSRTSDKKRFWRWGPGSLLSKVRSWGSGDGGTRPGSLHCPVWWQQPIITREIPGQRHFAVVGTQQEALCGSWAPCLARAEPRRSWWLRA